MDIYILTKSLKGVILIKKSSLHHISIGHIYCQHRDARVLNFVQSQKIWTLYMSNRFKLVFIIAEKFSPVDRSKLVVFKNSDLYMKFCARDIYGSFMFALKDLLLEAFKKDKCVNLKLQELHYLQSNFNFFYI